MKVDSMYEGYVKVQLTGGPCGDAETMAAPDQQFIEIAEYDGTGFISSIYKRQEDGTFAWLMPLLQGAQGEHRDSDLKSEV